MDKNKGPKVVKKTGKPVAKKITRVKEEVITKEPKVKTNRLATLKKIGMLILVVILIFVIIFGAEKLVSKYVTYRQEQEEAEKAKEQEEKEKAEAAKVKHYENKEYTGVSIIKALDEIDVNSSYFYRVLIAGANEIESYQGTAEQNLEMVALLQEGKLKEVVLEDKYEKSTYEGYSIVDALDEMEEESTYYHRAVIAAANEIDNYRGTPEQNLKMLDLLQKGELLKVSY